MLVEENERFSIPNISHLSPDFVLEHTECEAADIWSVGGLLFFMLNGRLPFGRSLLTKNSGRAMLLS